MTTTDPKATAGSQFARAKGKAATMPPADPESPIRRDILPVRHHEVDPFSPPVEDVERLAAQLWASEKYQAEAENLHRWRVVARQRLRLEAQMRADSDPATWMPRFARAGVQGLCVEWPGCPAPLSWGVRPSSGYRIDPSGIHFIDRDTAADSFVASPCVALEAVGSYALMKPGGEWVTVDIPVVPRGTTGDHWRQTVLSTLVRNGLAMGVSVARANSETEPASVFAAQWCGLGFRGVLGVDPVAPLHAVADEARDARELDPDMTPDAKMALAGAMAAQRQGRFQ